jgi:hypothetical protein
MMDPNTPHSFHRRIAMPRHRPCYDYSLQRSATAQAGQHFSIYDDTDIMISLIFIPYK